MPPTLRYSGAYTERPWFKLSLLSIGHFFNDLYASFFPTFLPGLVTRLGLSMAQAGFFSTLLGAIHIVFQPVVGYLSDRSSNPWLIIFGPILTCLGACLIPLSPTYGAGLLFVSIWALGSAMFHPQGHGGVGHVVPRERLTVSLAVFAVAGTAGTTLSPLLAVGLAETVGLKLMPVVNFIPVALLGWYIWRTMPSISRVGEEAVVPQKGLFATLTSVFSVIYPVWIISTIRDAVSQGVRIFLPLRLAFEGRDLAFIGTALFLLMAGSTVSMVIMGRAADRWGKKRVLVFAMMGTPVLLLAGRMLSGWGAILFFALGTAAINATMPVTAAIAQELTPNSRGMASSVVMGLSWGIANMLMGPFGKVGDLFGVDAILLIVALLPLLCLPMLFTKTFQDAK